MMTDDAELLKDMDKILLESDERYRLLVRTMKEGICVLDKESRILFANDSFCRMTGYATDELTGLSVAGLLDEKNLKIYEKELARRRNGHEDPYELELIKKDGRQVHVKLSPKPVFNGKKDMIGCFAVITDTTMLREAEEKLRVSEKKFRDLADNSLVGITQADLDGNIIYVNNALLRMYEFGSLDELKKKNVAELYRNPEDREAFIRELKKTGRVSNYELEVVTGTGKAITILISATLENNIISGMVMDITDIRSTEEKLRNALEYSGQRNAETEALLESSRAVLKNQTFEDTAKSIFHSCKKLTGAAAGYVALLADDGQENEVLYLDSGGRVCAVDPSLPMQIRGLREEAYRTRRAVHNNDFSNSKWRQLLPEGHMDIENIMFIPLVIRKKPAGLLGLANKPGGFTRNDVRIASAFGDLASVALLNSTANEALIRSRDTLETKVKERTAELLSAVKSLESEIAERVALEEKLRRSELWMTSIYDSLNEAVLVVTQDRKIQNVNSAAKKMFGYSEKELKGRSTEVLHVDHEHYAEFGRRLMRAVSKKESAVFEFIAKRKDGGIFPTEHAISAVNDSSGKLIGIVSVVRDITERKKSEKMISTVAEKVSVQTGKEYFNSLVEFISKELDTEYSFIGELDAPENKVRTIAVCAHGKITDNLEYGLQDTPCGNVMGKEACVYPQNVQELFPEVKMFADMKAESYAGIPLFASGGEPLGIIVTLGRRPFNEKEKDRIISLLQIFSSRASAEIERGKTSEALIRSEGKYRDLYDNAPDMYHSLDSNGTILACNSKWEQALGYKKDEIIGRHLTEFYTEDSARLFGQTYPDKIADKKILSDIEREFVRKDGSILPVVLNVFAEFDAGGKFIGSRAIARDISSRKKAEQERKSYYDLLESIRGLQCRFIAETGHKILFNEILSDILSLTHSRYGFIGEVLYGEDKKPYLKTHAISNIAWDKQTKEFYKKNGPKGMEFRNLKTLFGAVLTTGKPVISNDPLHDNRKGGLPTGHPPLDSFMGLPFFRGSQMIGIIGLANRPGGYDKKQVNYLQPFLSTCGNLLQAYNNDQKRKKAERSLHEAYQKLRETQGQLMQSSKMVAMGQVASGIAHELNQPLTGIKGFAQAMQMDLDKDSPLHGDIDRIIKQADRMEKIITNVRSFAKKARFVMEDMDINQPIKDTLELLGHQLKVHDVNIKRSLGRNLPRVKGDYNQLEQVFINLLTNARDAIGRSDNKDNGEITIKSALSRNRKNVEVTFRDNGCGISEEHIHSVFEPFYTTKPSKDGPGLGMSIVKSIIEKHNGDIKISSEEGKWTKVKVKLPIINADDRG